MNATAAQGNVCKRAPDDGSGGGGGSTVDEELASR